MANRDRVKRYKTEGAAADLVRVEVLVPPDKRDQIVNLAALLRQEHRASRTKDELEPLRRFRADVDAAFPGRLRDIVLFGSRARGDNQDDSDWDVAVYIDDFDRGRESRRLNMLAVPYHLAGIMISPVGLPTDRHDVSPDLLRNIDSDGVRL